MKILTVELAFRMNYIDALTAEANRETPFMGRRALRKQLVQAIRERPTVKNWRQANRIAHKHVQNAVKIFTRRQQKAATKRSLRPQPLPIAA